MKGLERLAALYERVERMEAARVQLAAAAVADVTRERMAEEAYGRAEGELARAALVDGDRRAWVVAASAGEFAADREDRLARVQVQREAAYGDAMADYTASRLQSQQVLQVVERRQRSVKVLEERRAQATADDRYGARLGWTRAQESMKDR